MAETEDADRRGEEDRAQRVGIRLVAALPQSKLAREMRMTLGRATAVLHALLVGCMVVGAFSPVALAEQASQPGFARSGGLDAGVYHTCALMTGGTVRCWGASPDGQLGYGNTQTIGDDETPSSAGPVDLGPGRAVAISAGDYHTCALLEDGSVRCWGFGADGRLGYGNTNSIGDNETPRSSGPVNLGPGRAVAISAGGGHTCALLEDGSVRCWGFGGSGQLGYGNTNNVGDTPGSTPGKAGPVKLGPQRAVAISAGGRHTCALLEDGSVRCWGFGANGRLGYGNTNTIGDNETPASGYALAKVACPAVSQCTAVDGAGQQVTFDPSAPGTPAPTTIDPGNGLTGVACPAVSQCTAVDDSGQQVTFNPSAPGTPTPSTIDGSRAINGVACPSTTQCTAVDVSGRQVTFNPSAPSTPTPSTIDGLRPINGVACPSTTQCTAVDNVGDQVTFDPNVPGTPTPTTIDPTSNLAGVACPSTTQCTAVDNVGKQVTFNPGTPGTPTPTVVEPATNLVEVACPSTTQCTAVDNVGKQVTFNPMSPGNPTPTGIALGEGPTGVACPLAVQCTAVGAGGRQVTFDPTGPGTPTPTTIDPIVPVNLGSGRSAKALSAGAAHTCAVLDNGTVRCWGLGGSGQLGLGDRRSIGDNETPQTAGPVDLGSGRAAAVSAGGSHTCARLEDGDLRCWGYGGNGQLGYGSTATIGDDETPNTAGPVSLGSGRSGLAVSSGQNHTCARLDDDSVRCWGYGANGRLGYCNQSSVGDDELPGAVGPVDLEPGSGGAACPPRSGGSSITSVGAGQGSGASKAPSADAARARGLRGCLANVASHLRREQRLARRGSTRQRAKVKRHLHAHARSGRQRCLRVYGRTPGRISGLRARTIGRTQIELRFNAPGTDGNHGPAVRSYVVKQSRRPIGNARAFARARTLCSGACRFTITAVGGKVTLIVTDLRPHTTYYYVVAARDNVSARRGPRSQAVKVKTR